MDELLRILKEVDDEIDYEHETAMIDDEIIDSLKQLKIISALDDAYHIHIDTAEIEPENFNTLQAIWELVQSCMEKENE